MNSKEIMYKSLTWNHRAADMKHVGYHVNTVVNFPITLKEVNSLTN